MLLSLSRSRSRSRSLNIYLSHRHSFPSSRASSSFPLMAPLFRFAVTQLKQLTGPQLLMPALLHFTTARNCEAEKWHHQPTVPALQSLSLSMTMYCSNTATYHKGKWTTCLQPCTPLQDSKCQPSLLHRHQETSGWTSSQVPCHWHNSAAWMPTPVPTNYCWTAAMQGPLITENKSTLWLV